MCRFSSFSPARVMAVVALTLLTPFAMAGGSSDVSWSVTIGSPLPMPRMYVPAPVVYMEPQPVYVRPQPVYVRPAPVVHYAPVYYVDEVQYRKPKHRHWKHRHHHDD